MEFDRRTIVLLVRPPDAPELTTERLRRSRTHLPNQARLGDEGYVVAAGPLLDQDDERLRGIAVLSVDPRPHGGSTRPARLFGEDGSRSRC